MARTIQVSETKPQDFEEILDYIGGLGRFQFLILFLLLVMEIPAAFVGISPIFTGGAVDPSSWTCDDEPIFISELCSCNGTVASSSTSSIVGEWSLVCDAAWVSDFITSIQMAGMMFGNMLASQLADWYGRRWTYLGGNMFLLGGTILSAVSPNPYVYAVARFLSGAGFAGYLGLTATYTIEFMPAKWRQLGGSVGPFGEATMLFALIAFFVRPWRTLLWLSIIPYIALLGIMPFLVESPRWLLRNKRVSEAHKILANIAKINGHEPIELHVLYDIAKKESGDASEDGCDKTNCKIQRFSYLDFFRYKELRLVTLCLMIIWSSWSISYFGLTYNIKNSPGNLYVNVAYLGLADALGFPSFLVIGNFMGRRHSVVLFTTFCSTFLVAIAIMFLTLETSEYPSLILLFAMLAKYGTAGARSAVRCLTGESFPTSIRSMGCGISSCACGFAGFIGPQLAFLGTRWPSIPYFAFAGISICGSLFSLLISETTGKPLTDEIVRRISIGAIVPPPQLKRKEENNSEL